MRFFFSLFTAGTDDAHVIDIAPSHQNSTFSSLIIEFCICANTSVMQDNICSPFSLNNIRYGVHFVSIFDMKFQFRFDPLKKFFYWNENEHFQLKSNVRPILDASITGCAVFIFNYAFIQDLAVHMNLDGLVYVFLDYLIMLSSGACINFDAHINLASYTNSVSHINSKFAFQMS